MTLVAVIANTAGMLMIIKPMNEESITNLQSVGLILVMMSLGWLFVHTWNIWAITEFIVYPIISALHSSLLVCFLRHRTI